MLIYPEHNLREIRANLALVQPANDKQSSSLLEKQNSGEQIVLNLISARRTKRNSQLSWGKKPLWVQGLQQSPDYKPKSAISSSNSQKMTAVKLLTNLLWYL